MNMLNTNTHKSIFKKQYFGYFFIVVMFLIVAVYLTNKLYQSYNRFNQAKEEISFAYDHPEIVKVLREDYASKSALLIKSFTEKSNEKTPEQKLIEEVVNQLKAGK